MARLSVRLKDDVKKAYDSVCEQHKMNKSTLIKGYVQNVVDGNGENIDEDVLFKAKEAYIRDDKKAWQRALHLPNNFHEECTTQLREKRYPMHPEEVHEFWYTSYREIIEAGLDGESRQRKLAQLTHTLNMYDTLHFSTPARGYAKIDAALDFAGPILVEEDQEAARGFISELINSNILSDTHRDEAFDRLRDLSVEQWRDSWEEATRPWLTDGDTDDATEDSSADSAWVVDET